MKKKKRIDLEDRGPLSHNPFTQLSHLNVPCGTVPDRNREQPQEDTPIEKSSLTIQEEKRPRGKWVTCIYHLEEEPEVYLKKLKKNLGAGGCITTKLVLEIQGHHREKACEFMRKHGFKVR